MLRDMEAFAFSVCVLFSLLVGVLLRKGLGIESEQRTMKLIKETLGASMQRQLRMHLG